MVDTPFVDFAFPATGTPTNRTMPHRLADVYNVMDFGAEASGSGLLLSSRYGSGAPGLAAAQAAYPLLPTLTLADTIDWAAIQSAINAVAASTTQGGTVFVPAGNYVVSRGIEINVMVGSIIGTGTTSFIYGNLPNEFVFNQSAVGRGPKEISNLSIANVSTWIGSGGMRLCNTTCSTYNNLSVSGMIAILCAWDIYNSTFNNCEGTCPEDGNENIPGSTGYNGTVGFAGSNPANIKAWRTTRPMMTAIQVCGSNSSHIDGCGIENSAIAILLGMYAGWASHCTVASDASSTSILNISSSALMGGSVSPGGPGGNPFGEFTVGGTLFGRGLALPAWGSDPNDTTGATVISTNSSPTITDATTTITAGGLMTVNGIAASGYGLRVGGLVEGSGVPGATRILSLGTGAGGTGTYNVTAPGSSISARAITATDADIAGTKLTGSGNQGTYRINGTYTITTPIPIWARRSLPLTGITVSSIQTEACVHSIYVNSVGDGHISGAGFGASPGQCENQFGSTGLSARAPFYLRSAYATTISGIASATGATTLGGIYIDGTNGSSAANGVIFESCFSQKGADNVTTGSIADDIMITTAWSSGASLSPGMVVTGSGVAANTVITGGLVTEPLTETVTITIASPGVVTRASHGLSANDPIMLYNQSQTLPTGLSIRTIYYVKTVVNANSFTLSATPGGTAINTSGSQSGTHYLDRLDGSTGLSGYSNTGTWRVSPGGQSVSSRTLNVLTGNDWVMPTNSETKAGLKLVSCVGVSSGSPSGLLNGLSMTFNSLPGEAGGNVFVNRVEGAEFDIVDGCKSLGPEVAPAFGDTVIGGGTGHYKVRWNGTHWTRCG